MAAGMQVVISNKDETIAKLKEELEENKREVSYWQQQAEKAAEEARLETERRKQAEDTRALAIEERDKALRLAEIRYHEMLVEKGARTRTEQMLEAQREDTSDTEAVTESSRRKSVSTPRALKSPRGQFELV
mmetsp:Transcript_1248/g.2065  ORF Transcript_1248/g.2065 Transcript_1248/m.2065 type:complete len:132 (+) Transcript_1248:918-1313(+)